MAEPYQLDERELLHIHIPETDGKWNEYKNCFVIVKHPIDITLEHSLVSITKWEARHHPAKFLDNTVAKTLDENIDYIRCMTLEKGIDPEAYWAIPESEMNRINVFINDDMSSTVINNYSKSNSRYKGPIETSEVIYWEMIQCNIPIEFEHRHFGQLRKLIQVCNAMDNPQKMSDSEALRNYAEENRRRKAMIGSKE